MSRGKALAVLSPLTAEQWGMVTATQARELGVSRLDLSRLVQDDTLERIEPGARVYRLTGSPPDPDLDPLRAAWLQLGAGTPSAQRLRAPDAVVSHRSAATVLGLGDLLSDMHEFYTRTRHRLRRDDVRIRVQTQLSRQDWTIVRGLPVTTARKIITDLLHDREEIGHQVPGQPLGLDRTALGRGSSSSAAFARAAGDGFVRPAECQGAVTGGGPTIAEGLAWVRCRVVTDALSAMSPCLGDVIAEVLAENGPMTEDQLAAALAGRGVDLGDDPDEALDDSDGLVAVLADERWASLPALLAGRVFTHRVSGLELEHDILVMNSDLTPLDMLTEREEYQRLADGSPVIGALMPFDADTLTERGIPLDVIDDQGALLLPLGYLRGKGLGEGDVIALGLAEAGLLLDPVPAPVVTAETVAGLGRQLSAVLEAKPDEPMLLDVAVWTACADDPTLFTEPLPPLGAALDTSGLAHDGEWLAAPGFDFPRWWVERRCAAIAQSYDLSDDEALAVLAIVTLYDQVAEVHAAALTAHEDGGETALGVFAAELTSRPEPSPTNPDRAPDEDTTVRTATVRATTVFLAEPAVAKAVLAETIGAGSEGAAALGLFAETLEPLVPRAARSALLWLRGKAHERLADPTRAEAAYHAAESVDPQWPPVLVDLARYASDRGDAVRGLALLRRAGTSPDHVLVELLERFQTMPRPDLGRNQPCWCGSGRKYKKCHLHHEQLPLDERAAWLYQKAGMFLLDDPWRGAVAEAARVRAQFDVIPHAVLGALDDPLVADAVLFEGGAFTEFMATRGVLLPEDERLLAEQWLLIDRSVYEIERVRPGEGFTMRDVRTGEVHQVRERTASQSFTAGALVCARVVPAGDTTQIFGGIEPVAPHERDELIALLNSGPDPIELVGFLTRRFAPPALRNTEGDPMVLCETTLKTGDPAALTAKLDQTYPHDAREAAALDAAT